MHKEAASPIVKQGTKTYTYETVRDVQTVATIMQLITTTRAERIALVTMTLHFEQKENIHKHRLPHHNLHYYYENLRPLVRKTDEVFLVDHKFYFLLPGANLQGGAIVQDRLWDALLWCVHNTNEGDVLRPHRMSIGHSAYPVPSRNFKQCLVAANKVRLIFDAYPEKTIPPAETQQLQADCQHATDTDLPILARQLGIPYLPLLPQKLSTRVQQLVNPKLAQELGCYPLGRERDVLTVAMSNPPDSSALERLRQETGLAIFPVLVHPRELQTALKQFI